MTLLAQHEGLLVPTHCLADRGVPTGFLRQLQTIFAPDMCISWHGKKQRWVIEQCIEHFGGRLQTSAGIVEHSHLCRRIYVWLVRDEATDEYMPLGDRVIAKLHEMETYRKYGTGPEALKRFRAESAAFDRDQAEKKKEEAHGVFQYLRRHNRIVRNKLKTLMGRHDWLRPHK